MKEAGSGKNDRSSDKYLQCWQVAIIDTSERQPNLRIESWSQKLLREKYQL